MVKIKGLSQQCLLNNVHNRFISSLVEWQIVFVWIRGNRRNRESMLPWKEWSVWRMRGCEYYYLYYYWLSVSKTWIEMRLHVGNIVSQLRESNVIENYIHPVAYKLASSVIYRSGTLYFKSIPDIKAPNVSFINLVLDLNCTKQY